MPALSQTPSLKSSPSQAMPSKALLVKVVDDRVFLAQNIGMETLEGMKAVRCFRPQKHIVYHPHCDDFGPVNMAGVVRFIELLDEEIAKYPFHKIVFCADEGKRALTNAVFLLGAYMVFNLKATWKDLASCFHWVDASVAEPFRDATFSESDFGLTLMDCWMGLQKGIENGWVGLPTEPSSSQWGQINMAEYEHYDLPNNGYLHEVIPGRLLAFTGPIDLGGDREYEDDKDGYRQLSPHYYVRIFRELGVKTVVRLNEEQYDSRTFTAAGIRHHDLHFPDCTSPPSSIIHSFLDIMDSTSTDGGGVVAVHCKAGLGRTGTLIALHMMRSCGFRAKEAIAWLRIMRPGSVIGEQQHFLVAVENSHTAAAAAAAASASAAAATDNSGNNGKTMASSQNPATAHKTISHKSITSNDTHAAANNNRNNSNLSPSSAVTAAARGARRWSSVGAGVGVLPSDLTIPASHAASFHLTSTSAAGTEYGRNSGGSSRRSSERVEWTEDGGGKGAGGLHAHTFGGGSGSGVGGGGGSGPASPALSAASTAPSTPTSAPQPRHLHSSSSWTMAAAAAAAGGFGEGGKKKKVSFSDEDGGGGENCRAAVLAAQVAEGMRRKAIARRVSSV